MQRPRSPCGTGGGGTHPRDGGGGAAGGYAHHVPQDGGALERSIQQGGLSRSTDRGGGWAGQAGGWEGPGPPTGDVVSAGVAALDELRRRPEELRERSPSHFVLSVANNVLRDGISFGTAGDLTGGIRARLQEGEIQVDLTPDKVADVLLEHLHPRFRARVKKI